MFLGHPLVMWTFQCSNAKLVPKWHLEYKSQWAPMYCQSTHSSHECFIDAQKNSSICFNVWNHRDMCQGCPEMWQPYIHSCLRFVVSFHAADRHILIIVSLSPFQKPPCLPWCVAFPPTHIFSFFSFCKKILLFSDSWFKAIDPVSNTGHSNQWINQKRFSMRKTSYHVSYSLSVFCFT